MEFSVKHDCEIVNILWYSAVSVFEQKCFRWCTKERHFNFKNQKFSGERDTPSPHPSVSRSRRLRRLDVGPPTLKTWLHPCTRSLALAIT